MALGLVAAACATEATGAPATEADTTPATTAAPTTLPPTTAAPTTTLPATTTTEPPPVLFPLTGLPADNALLTLRPAVVAKVGNYDAHPTTGVNAADIVFEELINDHISRFALVYQSTFPEDPVGPIRSGRIQDVNLLSSLNAPILAWAGGNGTVTREIDDSELINLNQTHCAGSCFRVSFEKAPYNLYFDIQAAYDVGSQQGAGSPGPQFQFRADGDPVAGTPSAGVDLSIDAYDMGWTWNPDTGLYERTQNGKVHDERNGEQITTDNVVILAMVYAPGISNSPDAQSVGSGEVWVFSGGRMVHGTWSRTDRLHPFTLTADDGSPILLTPGRTFVELPRAGKDAITPN